MCSNFGVIIKNSNHPLISTNEALRPTHVEIDLAAIKSNFNKIKSKVGKSKIMPILKANAYGHGLVEIARLMEKIGADYLGVAVLEEGILLREMGIEMPILILGGVLGNQIPLFIKYNLTITASSIDKLKIIDECAFSLKTNAKVHLKIDTGMERIGVHYYNTNNFFEKSLSFKNLEIEGVYSHFANSESDNLEFTKLQLERFQNSIEFFSKNSIAIPLKHISNSGAILQLPEANLDMVRPGILLYGVAPSQHLRNRINVKPALEWLSRIVYFKVIKAGHPVGYGSTWKPNHNIRAVTIPVGYGDGYMRAMSNKAKVKINSKLYNVIGNISMDQIVVNIESDSAFNNDLVHLISNQAPTCNDLAEWAGTIPYEILTNINTRVPRVYINP